MVEDIFERPYDSLEAFLSVKHGWQAQVELHD